MSDPDWGLDESRLLPSHELTLRLSGQTRFGHYMIALYLAFVAAMLAVCAALSFFRLVNSAPTLGLTLGAFGVGMLALLTERVKRNELRFTRYITGADPISNCNVVRTLAEFREWEILRDDEAALLRICTPWSSLTGAQVLTIRFIGTDVFVNCISAPWSSVAFTAMTPADERVRAVVEAVGGKKA